MPLWVISTAGDRGRRVQGSTVIRGRLGEGTGGRPRDSRGKKIDSIVGNNQTRQYS